VPSSVVVHFGRLEGDGAVMATLYTVIRLDGFAVVDDSEPAQPIRVRREQVRTTGLRKALVTQLLQVRVPRRAHARSRPFVRVRERRDRRTRM
jgi:hypothetical protein